MTARLYSPSLLVVIDQDSNRPEVAKKLDADHVVNPAAANATEAVKGSMDGVGCDTVTTPMLLHLFGAGSLKAGSLITHGCSLHPLCLLSHVDVIPEYPFSKMETAYGTFGAAAKDAALKMLVSM